MGQRKSWALGTALDAYSWDEVGVRMAADSMADSYRQPILQLLA